MPTSKVLRGEIRKIEDRRREIREKIADLYEREAELTVEIQKFRVQDFLETADQHLRLIEWTPLTCYLNGPSGGMVILEGSCTDEVNDLVHQTLGLGYHDEAEIGSGVLFRVDDGALKLLINGPSTLLDFASAHHLNVQWPKFREILTHMEEELTKGRERSVLMRKVVEDLKIPEDA